MKTYNYSTNYTTHVFESYIYIIRQYSIRTIIQLHMLYYQNVSKSLVHFND